MMSKYVLLFFYVMMIGTVLGQEKVDLYPNGIVNQVKDVELGTNVPDFYAYIPDKIMSKIAFLIIPGGGYAGVAMKHEGHDVARKLKELGYVSYVLRYRLPNSEQQMDKRIAPIQDAQTALSYIRAHMDPKQVKYVGVLGFSAGGHLASTLSTHFTTDYRGMRAKKGELRPDFSVLLYPVISMEPGVTHMGSKKNLIGPDFNEEDVKRFSNELNIDKNTPPAFLMHAVDDKSVPIVNSERYVEGLKKQGISTTLFKYQTGGHGFGLINKTDERSWFDSMIEWVTALKLK